MSDLKNSKKFFQFFKASIHLKSDVQHCEIPTIMKNRDQMTSSSDEIETFFSVFFTSTESKSLINVDKASRKNFK